MDSRTSTTGYSFDRSVSGRLLSPHPTCTMSVRFDCRFMQLVQPLLDECLAGYPPLTVPAPNPRPLPPPPPPHRSRSAKETSGLRRELVATDQVDCADRPSFCGTKVQRVPLGLWPDRFGQDVLNGLGWNRRHIRRGDGRHATFGSGSERACFRSSASVPAAPEMVRMWMPARTYSIGWTCCESSTAKPPFT